MNKKVKKKNPLKLKACIVALSLWGLSAVLTLSSSPVMAAETASNTAQEQVARALLNKGNNLGNLQHYEEAFAAYNELITHFGNSQDPDIQQAVAEASYNKGIDLGFLNRNKEAVAAFNDLIARFGNSQNTKIQEQVAFALSAKGIKLDLFLNHDEEGIAADNDLITRFGNSQDELI